jgi:hypothetical protein
VGLIINFGEKKVEVKRRVSELLENSLIKIIDKPRSIGVHPVKKQRLNNYKNN